MVEVGGPKGTRTCPSHEPFWVSVYGMLETGWWRSATLIPSRPVIPIRDFGPSDAALCERIVAAVWRIPERITPTHFADFATHLYTIGSLTESTWAEVVDDGEVRGFLFGRIAGEARIATSMTGLRGGVRLVTRFAAMRGVGIGRKLRWVRAVRRHDRARASIEPPGETEVTLFAVDPSAQGRGYGRELMDRFVAACQEAGAARITVETDLESSFGFYDRYGFEAIGEFRSPMNALFSGGTGDSFVYELAGLSQTVLPPQGGVPEA